MANELWRLSAVNAEKHFRAGQLLPSDVLTAVVERLDAVNGRLNLFAHIDRDGAFEAAAASDARWKQGAPLGPLDGIVVTIKDNITVRGMPCAWGSELFLNFVPERDETPVERLREAGCIILGKTTCSEFTTAQTNVSTRAFGTTRNPWNLALTTGASSGGACGALASGIGPVALGTDGGGSIRRPASHCGLVGLKPSTGRVARRHGLPVILDDCEVIGPIARTTADLARVFTAIGKPHPEDRASLGFAGGGHSRRPLKRVWFTPRFDGHEVDPEIEASCAEAARRLAAIGFEVETGKSPFDLPFYEKHWPAIRDAGLAFLVRDKKWQGLTSDLHAGLITRGQSVTGADYVEALAAFSEVQAAFGRFFERYDLFMTPTAGTLPWPADGNGPARSRVFTGIINAAGNPAISIPCDPAPNGLPIGFQLVGPFGSDDVLVEVARQYELRHPWAERWPDL